MAEMRTPVARTPVTRTPGTRTPEDVVRSHALWATGAGLVPVPLFDLVAVTAIQLDMLKALARLHHADYSEASGKAFVSALTGSTFAKLGSSAVKALPVIGPLLGGVSMSVLSGASTYAVGQAALRSLEDDGRFLDVDADRVQEAYDSALERGRQLFSAEERQTPEETEQTLRMLKELGKLKKQGVLTEEEFEAKKREVLGRL